MQSNFSNGWSKFNIVTHLQFSFIYLLFFVVCGGKKISVAHITFFFFWMYMYFVIVECFQKETKKRKCHNFLVK